MRTWLPYALIASLGLMVAATADDIGKKMVDPVSSTEITVAKETPTVTVKGFKKEPGNYLDKVLDPVSGKEFTISATAPNTSYKGGLYYFESDANKAAFEKEPAKYAKVVLQ